METFNITPKQRLILETYYKGFEYGRHNMALPQTMNASIIETIAFTEGNDDAFLGIRRNPLEVLDHINSTCRHLVHNMYNANRHYVD